MESGNSHQFPIRAQSHVIEHTSLIILQDQLPRLWIVRTDIEDYGLDGEIEIVSKDGIVKGDIFKFQIKGHRKVKPKEKRLPSGSLFLNYFYKEILDILLTNCEVSPI